MTSHGVGLYQSSHYFITDWLQAERVDTGHVGHVGTRGPVLTSAESVVLSEPLFFSCVSAMLNKECQHQ